MRSCNFAAPATALALRLFSWMPAAGEGQASAGRYKVNGCPPGASVSVQASKQIQWWSFTLSFLSVFLLFLHLSSLSPSLFSSYTLSVCVPHIPLIGSLSLSLLFSFIISLLSDHRRRLARIALVGSSTTLSLVLYSFSGRRYRRFRSSSFLDSVLSRLLCQNLASRRRLYLDFNSRIDQILSLNLKMRCHIPLWVAAYILLAAQPVKAGPLNWANRMQVLFHPQGGQASGD